MDSIEGHTPTHIEALRNLVKSLDDLIGESDGAAKLTNADVETIKQRIRGGEVQRCIAADFNVSQSLISAIKRGRLRS